MSRKKVSTTVYLDEEQLVALKAISFKTGAPMAFTIRNAINAYIAQAVAGGALTLEDTENVSLAPLGKTSARDTLEEATIERVLRRLLAEQKPDGQH